MPTANDDTKRSELEVVGDAVIDKLAIRQHELEEKAEDVLSVAVKEDRDLTYEESMFLYRELSWDRHEQSRQMKRMGRVLRAQAICGTTNDRAELANRVSDCDRKLQEDGEQLRAEIEERQKALGKLEQDARLAHKRLEEVNDHLEILKQQAPPWAQKEATHRRRIINETTRAALHELETDVRHAEVLSDPSRHRNPQAYVDCVKLYDSKMIETGHTDAGVYFERLSPEWSKHVTDMQAELPEKRQRLEQLREQVEAEYAQIDSVLEVYWR